MQRSVIVVERKAFQKENQNILQSLKFTCLIDNYKWRQLKLVSSREIKFWQFLFSKLMYTYRCWCMFHFLSQNKHFNLQQKYRNTHQFMNHLWKRVLYCHLQHHNNTIIKTQEDFFNKIFTSHFIAMIRKGLLKVCVWEGAGDRTETVIFWPPLLWPSTLCLSRSSDAQPEALGPPCWVLVFFTASYQQLLWSPNSIGVPEGPFDRAWLSLPHLVSLHSNSTATLTWLLSWLSYIIVQRPLDRPLDLWNGMIDRHPAEITVMQFTGHSLPVHQSMSVSWALPCPISSAKSTHTISFDYWPLECVTSFRCITL